MASNRYPSPFYGSLLHSNGTLLFGSRGQPLYASRTEFTEDMLDIFWEWTWSGHDCTVDALLEGNNVCTYHAKSHIITYNVRQVGGQFNYVGDGTVEVSCTAGWQAHPYYDTDSDGNRVYLPSPSSVSIRCWCTLFGEKKELSGVNSLTANIWIDLMNNKWRLY